MDRHPYLTPGAALTPSSSTDWNGDRGVRSHSPPNLEAGLKFVTPVTPASYGQPRVVNFVTYEPGLVSQSSDILQDDGGVVTDASTKLPCQPCESRQDPVRSQHASERRQSRPAPARYHHSEPSQSVKLPSPNRLISNHDSYHSDSNPGQPAVNLPESMADRNNYTSSSSTLNSFGRAPRSSLRAHTEDPSSTCSAPPPLSIPRHMQPTAPAPSVDHLRNPIPAFLEAGQRMGQPMSLDREAMTGSMERVAHMLKQDADYLFYWDWANYYQAMYCIAYNEIQEIDRQLRVIRDQLVKLRRGHDAEIRARNPAGGDANEEVGADTESRPAQPENPMAKPRKVSTVWQLMN